MNNERTRRYLILTIVLLILGAFIYFLYYKNTGLAGMKLNLFTGNKTKAPELTGIAGWINSKPLKLSDLRGKVVVLDFMTYSCINCIRTFPYLNEWYKKYKGQGLVIIGVHTPEFGFEKDIGNVIKATKEFNIEFPIALDNDYRTWNAYNNHYWPHKFLIDKDGNIRYDHIGEGNYEETERQIQLLLKEMGRKVDTGVTKMSYSLSGIGTPELYFGYKFARVDLGSSEGYAPENDVEYKLPADIKENQIYLQGKWFNNEDNLMHNENKEGKIVLKFLAHDVNLVMDAGKEVKIEIRLDEKSLTAENKGADVFIENGRSFALVKQARLYNLVKGTKAEDFRVITIIVNSNGLRAYAFTFG